jgi:hypothetical protein
MARLKTKRADSPGRHASGLSAITGYVSGDAAIETDRLDGTVPYIVIQLGAKRTRFSQGWIWAIHFHVPHFAASKAFRANVLYPVPRITLTGRCAATAGSVPGGGDAHGSTIEFAQSVLTSIRSIFFFESDEGPTRVHVFSIRIHQENDAFDGTELETGFFQSRFRRAKSEIVDLDFASSYGRRLAFGRASGDSRW